MGRPYKEIMISESSMVREFSCDVPTEELEWHMDRRNREVTVLEGAGWRLQLESGLPFEMLPGHTYGIPRESWHRVIRGQGTLRVLIIEN